MVARLSSPLGELRACAGDEGLCALSFVDLDNEGGALDALAVRLGADISMGDHPVLARTQAQLAEYFAGARTAFDLPLQISGSAFRLSVWRGLQQIAHGETWSYKQLAEAVGKPKAARAVGSANGANPIPIIIPCHRVIAASGGLGGFTGGLDRKRFLLELEQ